jgi:hypothetical protein
VNRPEDRHRQATLSLPGDVAAEDADAIVKLIEPFVHAARQQQIVDDSSNAQLVAAHHAVNPLIPREDPKAPSRNRRRPRLARSGSPGAPLMRRMTPGSYEHELA